MPTTQPQTLTELLEAVRAGEAEALDRVFAQVYGELRRLAHVVRSGRGHATLETTALVHEAYLRLAGSERLSAASQRHFMRIAARAMRQVLVKSAERRNTFKRGGGQVATSLDEPDPVSGLEVEDLLALHRAVEQLEAIDPRQARVVECRFFAGLTIQETADALEVSIATANREWRMARAWLSHRLGGA